MNAAGAPLAGEAAARPVRIRLRAVRKVYDGGTVALDGIDLDVRDGEFVSLVGPSGCGKTTLLRIVADLDRATEGEVDVRLDASRNDALASAVVFQERSLLPWMTVRQNVEFAFDRLAVDGRERRRRTDEQLELVGLTAFAGAYPHELSGGMKQRVAVARAFAVDPQLLLLDEPFGALDEQTRVALAAQLLELWERRRKTVLFVTHGIEEAIVVSDRIVVLSARPGRIRAEIVVPFRRPRDAIELRADPAFGRLAVDIWRLLR